MPTATMHCNKCGRDERLTFRVGTKPELICDTCEVPMERIFRDVGVGDIIEDKMVMVGQGMLNAVNPSGVTRSVF